MEALWLIPALPLAGALLLALAGGLMPRRAAAAVGCASVGAAWIVSLRVAADYLRPTSDAAYRQTLFRWLEVGSFRVDMGLCLDQLSLVMTLIVTFVGFLIHLYAAEFMGRERDYSLFFCYMNLFVGSMLVLVLGDSLLSLYLGWEGVGLCSYLLIGFWHREPGNTAAAKKAFIITRVGDTSLAVGLFVIFWQVGTLDIRGAMAAFHGGAVSDGLAVIAALLVLGGAVGKSAQVPLQIWLPDAMAGPTPVSALIHAATMVTAGVYLIARTHELFLAAPSVMMVVAVVGVATAVLGALSALAQRDIKRVLAYSTMSQIGYMFLALGVGAWSAAIFHFVTHAFFKALLFLAAGMAIQATAGEHDLYRMGGLFRRLPWASWTFAVGGASLAGLPFVTAGFYSKEAILLAALSPPLGSGALWGLALLTAALTGIYISRAFVLAFLGPPQAEVRRTPGGAMVLAVVILAFFAVVAGPMGLPEVAGPDALLGPSLGDVFGQDDVPPIGREAIPLLIASIVPLLGVALGCLFFVKWRDRAPAFASRRQWTAARDLLLRGLGFDRLYEHMVVRPYVALASLNRTDLIDWLYAGLAFLAAAASRGLSATVSGRVRNYATGLLLGAVLAAVLMLLR